MLLVGVAAFASLAFSIVDCGSRTALVAQSKSDVCTDPHPPIYVLAAGPTPEAHDVLMRFDPPTAAFATVTSVPCLGPIRLSTVMAVDRTGTAFVVSRSDLNRQMFRVNTSTGACELTPFVSPLTGSYLAFSMDPSGTRETLYMVTEASSVYAPNHVVTPPVVEVPELSLSSIDTSTFASRVIGQNSDPLWASQLGSVATQITGTAAGDLFAVSSFYARVPGCAPLDASAPPGVPARPCYLNPPLPEPIATIGSVDVSSASVSARWMVPAPPDLPTQQFVGFAFWGADFYFFAASAPGTLVFRFRPSDGSFVQVAETDSLVLAVSASTCAPVQ